MFLLFSDTFHIQGKNQVLVMSEKLCLQWNDFKDNAINAFGSLRDDNDFTDVTLACEDGKQVEVHKVVLASSSQSMDVLFPVKWTR